MRKFIKENWFKLIICFIIVFIAAFTFFWFELRPKNMREECYDMARVENNKKAGEFKEEVFVAEYSGNPIVESIYLN